MNCFLSLPKVCGLLGGSTANRLDQGSRSSLFHTHTHKTGIKIAWDTVFWSSRRSSSSLEGYCSFRCPLTPISDESVFTALQSIHHFPATKRCPLINYTQGPMTLSKLGPQTSGTDSFLPFNSYYCFLHGSKKIIIYLTFLSHVSISLVYLLFFSF